MTTTSMVSAGLQLPTTFEPAGTARSLPASGCFAMVSTLLHARRWRHALNRRTSDSLPTGLETRRGPSFQGLCRTVRQIHSNTVPVAATPGHSGYSRQTRAPILFARSSYDCAARHPAVVTSRARSAPDKESEEPTHVHFHVSGIDTRARALVDQSAGDSRQGPGPCRGKTDRSVRVHQRAALPRHAA